MYLMLYGVSDPEDTLKERMRAVCESNKLTNIQTKERFAKKRFGMGSYLSLSAVGPSAQVSAAINALRSGPDAKKCDLKIFAIPDEAVGERKEAEVRISGTNAPWTPVGDAVIVLQSKSDQEGDMNRFTTWMLAGPHSVRVLKELCKDFGYELSRSTAHRIK